ncbi:Adipocyte plasma membrane-associated protein [Triticum urartu]|uniref:Adipocyte plasma membrane-associated protein n=1 Tax=Triticum urartu TaxID=4572 RepID=M8AR93_TRIUA|nr:Adipocyte plasma membrane-associated protein [Triticum urartu]
MALGGLFGTAAVAVVVSLAVHVALNCPIQPLPSPRPPPPAARYRPNNLLQVSRSFLASRRVILPCHAAYRWPDGLVYAGAGEAGGRAAERAGGRVRGRGGGRDAVHGDEGRVAAEDAPQRVVGAVAGLLRVEEGRVTILASTVEGSTIRFADEAIEASDGTVYFSDASTRFGFDRWFHAYVESQPTGRLLKYDPRTGKASVALDNLSFANGVALSRDEAFVIVCETGRFKCTRLWLKGDNTGQAETFVGDLPGSPDNIQLAPDGSFWIALIQRSPWLDLVMRWTFTKRVVASFPALLDAVHATGKGAMVAQVSEDGEVLRVLDDTEGKVINFITSVTEFNGDLFFGSLATNFVGKLSLAKVAQAQGQAAASS